MNRVFLAGHLGADPELKVTKGGQAILRLRVATTESFVDASQNRQERTEWHSVTVWGKRGEGLAKHLAKGDKVIIEGQLRTRSWETDGGKRYATEVNALSVEFAGSKGGERREGGGGRPSRPSSPPASAPPSADARNDYHNSYKDYGPDVDDEIPF